MSHPLPPYTTPLPAHSIVSLHLSTSARLFSLLASLDAHESYYPISPFWDSRIANFIFKAKANPHLTPLAAISKGFSSPSLFRTIITISPLPPSPPQNFPRNVTNSIHTHHSPTLRRHSPSPIRMIFPVETFFFGSERVPV